MQDQLFFRVRKNGTAVFRISEDQQTHRLEMTQIAVLKDDTGAIKPHHKHDLTPDEHAKIKAWHQTRQSDPKTEIDRLCDQINLAAQWIQAEAEDTDIAQGQDRMLLSIHDLRSALVRRISKL